MRSGAADVVIGNRIGMTSWLLDRDASDRCDNFTFSPGVVFQKGNPRQIFLALNRSAGFELFSNVQVALGWLRQKAPAELIGRIYARELRYGEGCPARAAGSSDRIGLESQLGVFVIFGGFFVAAAIAAIIETRLLNQRERRQGSAPATVAMGAGQGGAGDDDADATALTDGDMLREIFREMRRTRGAADAVLPHVAQLGALQEVDLKP